MKFILDIDEMIQLIKPTATIKNKKQEKYQELYETLKILKSEGKHTILIVG